MSSLYAAFIGSLQGLTEFLPVSSSGHLIAYPYLLHLNEPALAVVVLAHLGTLFAVLVAFRKKIIGLLQKRKDGFLYIKFLLIGTLPAVAAALFFQKRIETAFQSPALLPVFFLGTALLTFLLDKLPHREEELCSKKALFIGIWQAGALFPGISRMGTTLFGSSLSGLSTQESIEFSFLLSIPAIAGGALFEARHIAHIPLNQLFIVFLSSFLCGLLAIFFLNRIAQKGRFSLFSFYLVALALLLWIKK